MTFEAGVKIITIVIAWRGKVVFLNLMFTLSQCCVVIVMQIKLTVIVAEERLSNLVPFPSRFKEGRSLTTGLQG